jgi:hypothetical protein
MLGNPLQDLAELGAREESRQAFRKQGRRFSFRHGAGFIHQSINQCITIQAKRGEISTPSVSEKAETIRESYV